jgi:hypothetical protein
MAVKTKSISTRDVHSRNSTSVVHYVKLTKSNKKGVAELVGGQLIEHKGRNVGDFHIFLKSTVNGKPRTLNLESGDIVFRTGKNTRWQSGTRESLKKRFPNAKFQ